MKKSVFNKIFQGFIITLMIPVLTHCGKSGPEFKNEVIEQNKVINIQDSINPDILTIHKVTFDVPDTNLKKEDTSWLYKPEEQQIIKIDFTYKHVHIQQPYSDEMFKTSKLTPTYFSLASGYESKIYVRNEFFVDKDKDAFTQEIVLQPDQTFSGTLYFIVKGKGVMEANRDKYVLDFLFGKYKIPLQGRKQAAQ